MKRLWLVTCLIVLSAAAMSVTAGDARRVESAALDRQVVGVEARKEVGDAPPRLMAGGDAWETRARRFSQPLSPRDSAAMQRRGVRETHPWWR